MPTRTQFTCACAGDLHTRRAHGHICACMKAFHVRQGRVLSHRWGLPPWVGSACVCSRGGRGVGLRGLSRRRLRRPRRAWQGVCPPPLPIPLCLSTHARRRMQPRMPRRLTSSWGGTLPRVGATVRPPPLTPCTPLHSHTCATACSPPLTPAARNYPPWPHSLRAHRPHSPSCSLPTSKPPLHISARTRHACAHALTHWHTHAITLARAHARRVSQENAVGGQQQLNDGGRGDGV